MGNYGIGEGLFRKRIKKNVKGGRKVDASKGTWVISCFFFSFFNFFKIIYYGSFKCLRIVNIVDFHTPSSLRHFHYKFYYCHFLHFGL